MTRLRLRVERGRRKHKKLNRKEVATIGALKSVGLSNYAIQKRTGIDDFTVGKYLKDQEAYNNPKMKEMMASIIDKEIFDLTVLTVKARKRLHDLAPSMNPIESIALMDRAFQQRRLLEGKSTQNISTLQRIIREANKDLEG